MAQHVQDPTVVERRLRPIYDCLELGNNKKAIQEAEKVLKKSPTIQCAKALKALALLRIGRDEEADTLVSQVADEKPYDDPTLQVMTFCYKEREQLDKICSLYANAVKQAPANEEILSHLFMSHVRVNDFQSQQSVALQLYKLKPKKPYYFWAVMSIVLKAVRGSDKEDSTKSNVLLALSQRMIDKQINENNMDAEQEVQLYLTILKYQHKYQDALDFMESELGKRIYPGAPISMKIELLKSLKKWSELNVLLKNLLREHRDRWDYFKDYLLTVVELVTATTEPKQIDENADANFEQCHEFICQLIETGNKMVRGPFLARLELHKIMSAHQHQEADELLGDFLELLVEYFRKFGDKPCCANDIILFLDNLETDRRAGLASRLLEVCELTPTTLPQNKEQMQKHICSLQVSRICGAHGLSDDHLAALYTVFAFHYEYGMTAFGNDLLPTDMGPSDAYALLSVHVMYDSSLKRNSSNQLVEALYILNYLLTKSPSNFHAKLLCLQIYHRLGCIWGAHKTYLSLDVKYIQLDSMGYLHCAQLPNSGMASIAKPLYDTTLKFFTDSYKESLEYLAMCYRYGSFSKLEEFMDFRDRLSNSLHYSLISVEAALLELVCLSGLFSQNMLSIKSMKIDPFEDRIPWDDLRDNRDLSVVIRWDPKQNRYDDETLNDEDIKQDSFKQDVELLVMRSTLLRIVSGCVELVTKETSTVVETLELLESSWTDLWLKLNKINYKPISNKYLVNLLPSRLHGMLSLPYNTFFKELLRLILALHQRNDDADNLSVQLINSIKTIKDIMFTAISEHNECEDVLIGRRAVQEKVVNCIEILSLTAFIMSVCCEKFSLTNSSKTTRKTKRKGNSDEATATVNDNLSDKDRWSILQNVTTQLKLAFTQWEQLLDTWKCPKLSEHISDRIAAMSLGPSKVEAIVNSTITDNHSMTVKELQKIISDKIRMLK